MKSFKYFVKEENKGGFIAIKPDIQKAQYYANACQLIGIEDCLSPEEMHVTLFYDRREPIIDAYEPKNRMYKAFIKSCALYNDALVLELDSTELKERFLELKMIGFKSDYPEYKPHLTLKYGATQADLITLRDNWIMFEMMPTLHLMFEYSESIKK